MDRQVELATAALIQAVVHTSREGQRDFPEINNRKEKATYYHYHSLLNGGSSHIEFHLRACMCACMLPVYQKAVVVYRH